MDPHLLLFLLNKNIGKDCQKLQDQIKKKLIGADQKKAGKLEKEAEAKAHKLLTLLKDPTKINEMRKE